MKKGNIVKLIIANAILLPIIASAQVTAIPTGSYKLSTLLDNIVNAILLVGGAMAVIMFVYAGITFLIANGNPEKVSQARQAFLWGVAGVVVMLLGTGIVMFVKTLMTTGA